MPLEKEFANITVSDPERDTTYRMAENLNTQLRLMSEDLKEVIEHINEKNKNQDTSDPVSSDLVWFFAEGLVIRILN